MGLLIGVGDFGIGDLIARAEALYGLLEELCGDSLSWVNIINKPTTLEEFGITDAYTQAQIATLLSGKMDADFQYSWNDLLDRPTNIAESGILDVYTKEEVDELIGDLAVGEHTHEISDINGLQDALDALQFKLVSDLPGTPAKNTVYCVYSAGKFTLYVTDNGSTPTVYNLDAITAAQLATALNSKQNKLTGTDAQYVKGDGTYGTFNKAAIGLGNVANIPPSDYPISDATQAALDLKATDSNVLHKTGNETKSSGVLTFVNSPVVPNPTNSGDAVNKGYLGTFLDDILSGNVSIGGTLTVAGQIISDAIGIAPFVVASSIMVTGLNVEMLGGMTSADFVPITRQINNGTGILGGGDLSLNRTLSLDLSYTDTRYAGASHTHATLIRGTGLTGSNYNGSSGTTWAVAYGTSAGTAVEGTHVGSGGTSHAVVNGTDSGFMTPIMLSALTSASAATHSALTLGATAYGLGLSGQVLSMQAASGSTNGALLATDWTTFNNKQSFITPGTNPQYWRGDKSWQTLNTSVVPELTNLYFTTSRVLATAFAGFGTGTNTPITSSDTILTGVQNLQAQISALGTGLSSYVPTSRTVTINGASGRITSSAGAQDFTANRTWTVDLATAGTAGTYRSVTTDAYGRVTSGTNPTTVSGYGITDILSQVLTGYTAGTNTTLTASHSILNGFRDLQAQITTLGSSSHAALTLGATAHGLSLAGQVLSLQAATASVPGALLAADWTTFNNKIGGSGTTATIPVFTGTRAIGDSLISQSGTNLNVRAQFTSFGLNSHYQYGFYTDAGSGAVVFYNAVPSELYRINYNSTAFWFSANGSDQHLTLSRSTGRVSFLYGIEANGNAGTTGQFFKSAGGSTNTWGGVVAADVSDFTTAGRALISATGAISYNPSTGQISYTGGTGSGSVTSVGLTLPTGLSVTPSSITTSGTFAVTYTSGYSIPTDATQAIWTAKQAALSGTGLVKSTSGTISYITDNSSSWNNAILGATLGFTGRLPYYTSSSAIAYTALVYDVVNTRLGVNNGAPAYTLDVQGDINTSAMYRVAGSAGGAGTFLKSAGTSQNWAGIVTSDVSGLSTAILGQVLTGYTAGSNTVITSSHTALNAFRDLQAQISGLGTTSHVALTLGTTNGLSLAGQVLSLQAATASVTGALTASDWASFNAKIAGSGTNGTLPIFTGASTLGNSPILVSSSNVYVGAEYTEFGLSGGYRYGFYAASSGGALLFRNSSNTELYRINYQGSDFRISADGGTTAHLHLDGSTGNVSFAYGIRANGNAGTTGQYFKSAGGGTNTWGAITSGDVTGALGFTPVVNTDTWQTVLSRGSVATTTPVVKRGTSASTLEYIRFEPTDYGTGKPAFSIITDSPTMWSMYASDGLTFGIVNVIGTLTVNSVAVLTASSTNTLTNKSGNISMWTNNSGYLTNSDIGAYGFLTSTSTNTIYNKSGSISMWSNDAGYLTSSSLSGYATQSYVTSQGYISSASVYGQYSISGGGNAGNTSIYLSLQNDQSSPGNDMYYGTNGSGSKGWYSLPSGGGGGVSGSGTAYRFAGWNGTSSLTDTYLSFANYFGVERILAGSSGTRVDIGSDIGFVFAGAMTASQRTTASQVKIGSIVLQTDGTDGFYGYKGSGVWVFLG